VGVQECVNVNTTKIAERRKIKHRPVEEEAQERGNQKSARTKPEAVEQEEEEQQEQQQA